MTWQTKSKRDNDKRAEAEGNMEYEKILTQEEAQGTRQTVEQEQEAGSLLMDGKTIYQGDALNQTIYGNGGFVGNIYGVENSDIYGGALNQNIYDTGRAEPEPAPVIVMEAEVSPQVDDREARRAELMAEMEAAREQSRDSQEIER